MMCLMEPLYVWYNRVSAVVCQVLPKACPFGFKNIT